MNQRDQTKKRRVRITEKKKKSSGKKDACYHKVKSRYDVWPSAYASGALSKCRKVGAANWGNKSKKNESLDEEFKQHKMYDPKTGKSVSANKEEDHHRLAKQGYTHVDPKQIEKVLKDEGGASGMEPFLKAIGKDMEEEIIKTLKAMPNVGQHKDKDYILDDNSEIEIVKEAKRKKAGTESSKESSLRDWFGRKGAKGKKGGWVDCNAPDGKGGYKACGRSGGEKRSKYPSCRPTPGACKEKGKGKSWGKKAAKGKKNESLELTLEQVERMIDEEIAALDEKKKKPCKKAKGKRYVKRVNGRCRSFGQAGKAKSGGDRIRPGTKKGDAYCARSAKIKKCKNPPCANDLSRKKWKCRGSKSMKE
jgi:hypothetical protein